MHVSFTVSALPNISNIPKFYQTHVSRPFELCLHATLVAVPVLDGDPVPDGWDETVTALTRKRNQWPGQSHGGSSPPNLEAETRERCGAMRETRSRRLRLRRRQARRRHGRVLVVCFVFVLLFMSLIARAERTPVSDGSLSQLQFCREIVFFLVTENIIIELLLGGCDAICIWHVLARFYCRLKYLAFSVLKQGIAGYIRL